MIEYDFEGYAKSKIDKALGYLEGFSKGYHQAKSEWVGLTDEQIEEIWGNTPMMLNSHNNRTRIVFAKAIEAKLKEKNS